MEMLPCPHCGAPIPKTGTFCLTCDTPVTDTEPGLSVGHSQVVQHGRPVLAVGVILGGLVTVGLIAYGILMLWDHHVNGIAATAAVAGVEVVLRAEAGHPGACQSAAATLHGTASTTRTECEAVMGTDPDAHIRGLHVTTTERHGEHATVGLRGTWVDSAGRRPYNSVVTVVEDDSQWRLAWDGKALADR